MSGGLRIDKRVRYAGTSYLRQFNSDTLRDLDDSIFVIQDRDEPVSVLLSYKLFMHIQDTIEKWERGLSVQKA